MSDDGNRAGAFDESRVVEALDRVLERLSKVEGVFQQRLSEVEKQFEQQLADRFAKMEARFEKVERNVEAIESFPVPYGRPRRYHTATEVHSVSMAVRKSGGFTG